MDVHQLLEHLDLKDVVLLGWSMGCSVLWSYWDLFRSDRLSKLIMVDEPSPVPGERGATRTASPTMTPWCL